MLTKVLTGKGNWPASYAGENVKQTMKEMLCSSNSKPGGGKKLRSLKGRRFFFCFASFSFFPILTVFLGFYDLFVTRIEEFLISAAFL